MDDQTHRAHQYGLGLVLIGIALATRAGDAERVTSQLAPDCMEGMLVSDTMRALQERDRAKVKRFLASMGVQMQSGERAVDAILRTHLQDALRRSEANQARLKAAWEAEEKLALERTGVKA